MKSKPLSSGLLVFLALQLGCALCPTFAGDDDDKAAPKNEDADQEKQVREEGEAQGEKQEQGVISAQRTDLISKQMKKAVIVRGTLGDLNVFEKLGHAVLSFEEGEVAIFIRKENLDKHPDWDLKALVGKEIYVAGEVFLYRNKLEIVIVGPDQIAASPDGFDLNKIPRPESKKTEPKKKIGPAAPGAIYPTKTDLPVSELKLEEATVQTVGFYLKDTGWKIKEDPFGLPIDRLTPTLTSVTASVKKMEGIGPMQVAFPKPNEASKAQVKSLLDQLVESYGKWPEDTLVTIDVDFESRDFKDDPATLVIAALIHSLVTGKQLPPGLVISADVGEGGALAPPAGNEGGGASNYEILKALAADAAGPLRLVCAGMETDELNDLALDGDWATLASVSVLAAATLGDALRLIFADDAGELGKALVAFDQAQAVIKKSGVAMVKNAHVQQRVMAAGKAWPTNRSAVFYVYYAKNKVPRSYSLPRTHQIFTDLRNRLRYLQVSKPDDAKEQFREIGNQLRTLRPKIDPELATLTRALSDFESEASVTVLRPREGRSGERQEKNLKEADEEMTKELEALAAKISGVEIVEEKENEGEEE